MTGSQSTTSSPSRVTTSLSTPCMDGWWGPKFTTMGSVWVSSCVMGTDPVA